MRCYRCGKKYWICIALKYAMQGAKVSLIDIDSQVKGSASALSAEGVNGALNLHVYGAIVSCFQIMY